MYYRFKAAHDFALKSTRRRRVERNKEAEKAYDKLIRNFPKSQFLDESNQMLSVLKKEKEQLQPVIKS